MAKEKGPQLLALMESCTEKACKQDPPYQHPSLADKVLQGISTEINTMIGSLFPGESPALGGLSPHPQPRDQVGHLNLEIPLVKTFGQIEHLSKTHPDPVLRRKLSSTIREADTLLESVITRQVDLKKKPSIRVRVKTVLSTLKRDHPVLYRLMIIGLVSALIPLVLMTISAIAI